MPSEDKNIIYAILDSLQNDPQLSSYIKKYSAGTSEISRKLFPYINVGGLQCEVSEKTLGRRGYDRYEYRFEIIAGTKSLVDEKAFSGDNGILQICDDIVNVIRPNDFGIFDFPVRILNILPFYKISNGGTDWTAQILIHGVRTVQRND